MTCFKARMGEILLGAYLSYGEMQLAVSGYYLSLVLSLIEGRKYCLAY